MGRVLKEITQKQARRLALTRQHLAGRVGRADGNGVVSAIRDTCYIQWDPISVIAPSHVIALWSRLPGFRVETLEKLLWRDKRVFQHWAPIAMIVLTEDYPLYYSLMKGYPESLTKSWGSQALRAKKFMDGHVDLRKSIIRDLKKGPLQLTQFSSYVRTGRSTDGWSSGSDVSTMLSHLHMSGKVMVVGHEGYQNIWGLTEDFLPEWAERGELPREEVERMAAQRAIRALGIASPSEIYRYFIRGRYENLKGALQTLSDEGTIHRISVEGQRSRDGFYIHDRDLAEVQDLEGNGWLPRTTFLAHFDNMLGVRDWTRRVFNFDYVHEQFLPKEKRKYGTFVLPVVSGESIVGRLEPRMDRENGKLVISTIHAEPEAAKTQETGEEISDLLMRFASFLGAGEVIYPRSVPEKWKAALR